MGLFFTLSAPPAVTVLIKGILPPSPCGTCPHSPHGVARARHVPIIPSPTTNEPKPLDPLAPYGPLHVTMNGAANGSLLKGHVK